MTDSFAPVLMAEPDGQALVEHAGEMVYALYLTQVSPGEALSGTSAIALQTGMTKAALGLRLVKRGVSPKKAARVLGWEPERLSRLLRRVKQGRLGTLSKLSRNEEDDVMLAVAAEVGARPGIGFNRLHRDYGHLISDLVRLSDTLADRFFGPTNLNEAARAEAHPVTEGQIRVIEYLAGRSLLRPITVLEVARGELRRRIDAGRVGFIDATKVRTSTGWIWIVALRVGDAGVVEVVRGPESGRAAQRVLLKFLRRYQRTFDILVCDNALAYGELSFQTLLMQMGIQIYLTEKIVDNWIEREFGWLKDRMLSAPHLTLGTAMAHIRRLLRPLTEAEVRRLRALNFAQIQLLQYDRSAQVDVERGGAELGDLFFPVGLPDGEKLTAGIIYQYPDDLDALQWVRVDLLRTPVEVAQDDEGAWLSTGCLELFVVASYRARINGAPRVEWVDPKQPIPPPPPKDPERLPPDPPILPPFDKDPDVGKEQPGRKRRKPPTVPEPPDSNRKRKRPRRARVWYSPDGEFIVIRVGANEDFPSIVDELGLDRQELELARMSWTFVGQLRYLAGQPDFAEACRAKGILPRRKPFEIVVSKTAEPYTGGKRVVLQGRLVWIGSPRGSQAGEVRLRASSDHILDHVHAALGCSTPQQMRGRLEIALRKARTTRLRAGSRAAHELASLTAGLTGALAAIGRGERLVAEAILRGLL